LSSPARGRASGAQELLGAVLAGGASVRFGSPKWRATVLGQTMGARAVAALAPHTSRVVAISGDPEVVGLGIEARADLHPGRGPIGGIHTALAWAHELSLDGVVVLACDLPLVTADVVGAIVGAWAGEAVVAPMGPRGPEPLCALWSVRAFPQVEAAAHGATRSPRRLLEELGARVLGDAASWQQAGIEDPFLNVNTPSEHARAEAVLRGLVGRTF